jgi:hypothetical protein
METLDYSLIIIKNVPIVAQKAVLGLKTKINIDVLTVVLLYDTILHDFWNCSIFVHSSFHNILYS